MKKQILTFTIFMVLIVLSSLQLKAQISVGASVGYGKPLGEMADDGSGTGLSSGILLDFSGRYHINDNISVGMNIGYNTWSFTNVPSGITASFTNMPIMGAIDYNFSSDKLKPFVGLEMGLTNCNTKVSIPGFGDLNQSSSGLAFAPNAGVALALNENLDLFGKVKYFYGVTENSNSGIPNLTYIALNIGASLKF